MTPRPATTEDVVLLADAVNQLAMAVENLLPLVRNTGLDADFVRRTRRDVQDSLRRERERVAVIIERYDP